MTLHLNNFEFHSHRLVCAKFGGKWTSGSVEDDDENVKCLYKEVRTDRQMIRKADLSFKHR